MKRIASILTGIAFSALIFVVSAHSQTIGQRLAADIPFEFNVGNISLPAGQYTFQRTDGNIILIRNADGHSMFTEVTSPIQPYEMAEKSGLKFVTFDGRNVLV